MYNDEDIRQIEEQCNDETIGYSKLATLYRHDVKVLLICIRELKDKINLINERQNDNYTQQQINSFVIELNDLLEKHNLKTYILPTA